MPQWEIRCSMSKVKKDRRQQDLPFTKRVENHLKEKESILDSIHNEKPPKQIEDYAEACIELAAAVKRAIRQSGMSREAVVDEINRYFGWPTPEEAKKLKQGGKRNGDSKHLSYHMFNHHLSKPEQYPIPAPLLYAIHHVTDSLEPCRSFAEAEDGGVFTKDEKQTLALGKMEKAIYEMQQLKKQLRGKK